MHNGTQNRLRWDRIFMVLGSVVAASMGIAAMVPGDADFEDADSEGRVALVMEPVAPPPPSKLDVEDTSKDAGLDEGQEAASPAPARVQDAAPNLPKIAVEPAPTGPLPRKGIKPKKSMEQGPSASMHGASASLRREPLGAPASCAATSRPREQR